MDRFYKLLVDFFFRTNAKRKKFEILENEKVLAADGSKGIMTKENKEITRGADWIISQRAVIFLTNKRIVCGKWNIPVEKISRATLVKIKSIFGGGQVLKIDTIDNESYQFGMQKNNEWINQNVLNITVEDGNVKTSLFSWLLRIIVFGYLIYWLLQEFGVIVN